MDENRYTRQIPTKRKVEFLCDYETKKTMENKSIYLGWKKPLHNDKKKFTPTGRLKKYICLIKWSQDI